MGLFGLGKKKEDEKEILSGCCNGGISRSKTLDRANKIQKEGFVKVLGSGCAKCNELEMNVKKALEQLGMDAEVEHVTDFSVIAAYGVMSTPALVVDNKVVSYGKVLKVDEAVKILESIT